MKCDISIRITFPEDITRVLHEEKQRYITEYGSSYKSEPHITLYLDSYTEEGYPKLLSELRELRFAPFTISLLPPKVRVEQDRHRNLYVMEISNKESIHALQKEIARIADPYRSPFIREKTMERLAREEIHIDGSRASYEALHRPEDGFDPHITLGEIDFDKPQADIEISKRNLASIEGKEIVVTGVTVFFYGKKDGAEKYELIEEVGIPFVSR